MGNRPILAFGEELRRYPPHLALVVGERKILALNDQERLARGEARRAFDLATDPGEANEVVDQDWPRSLLEAMAPYIGRACEPRAAPSPLSLEGRVLEQLENLGYAGSD